MSDQRYLITGGAGFIGSHLVDRLLAGAPARVVAIDNFDPFYDPRIKRRNIEPHLANPAFRLAEIDICDAAAVHSLCADEGGFDAVIHLAARAGVRPSLASPRLYAQTNILGTINLLEAAREFAIPRFIFGSSSSIYGPDAPLPFREDAPLAPISPYAASKASGELIAHTYSRLYGLRALCLRFFTVYGPRQRPDLAIHKFARKIIAGEPLPLYGDGTTARDYTYIDDIIDGISAALEYQATTFEVINLGESQTVTLNELIAQLEEALGIKALITRLPMQPGDLPQTHADIDKARRLLGYDPHTRIETGLARFIAWLRPELA